MKRTIALASLAVLVGCGGGGGVGTKDSFKAAMNNLTKAKTAKATFTFNAPGGGYEVGSMRARFGGRTDMAIHYDTFRTPSPVSIGGGVPQTPVTSLTDAVVLGPTVYGRGTDVSSTGRQWGKRSRETNAATRPASTCSTR